MTLQELIADIPKLLAYTICIFGLFQLFFIFFLDRKDIRIGLKGKDKMWQFLELSGIVWLVLFPVAIVSALLGQPVDNNVWTTLDVVYFINVGGKGYYKSLENKQHGVHKEEHKVDNTGVNNLNP